MAGGSAAKRIEVRVRKTKATKARIEHLPIPNYAGPGEPRQWSFVIPSSRKSIAGQLIGESSGGVMSITGVACRSSKRTTFFLAARRTALVSDWKHSKANSFSLAHSAASDEAYTSFTWCTLW